MAFGISLDGQVVYAQAVNGWVVMAGRRKPGAGAGSVSSAKFCVLIERLISSQIAPHFRRCRLTPQERRRHRHQQGRPITSESRQKARWPMWLCADRF
jgi:hypothetical protein